MYTETDSLTISGVSDKVDSARLNVNGDVRAINLNELNAVLDLNKHVAVAML